MRIEDTGCGIPADKLSRIFDPFFTTKEVGKRSGLGLSIVYDIIKSHKGEIAVKTADAAAVLAAGIFHRKGRADTKKYLREGGKRCVPNFSELKLS
ncbi:MAG: hypothetical protein KKE17_12375 [Proteobacteria bacterium]|nr:hypothetical protein [Pseudomonadota bacterium]